MSDEGDHEAWKHKSRDSPFSAAAWFLVLVLPGVGELEQGEAFVCEAAGSETAPSGTVMHWGSVCDHHQEGVSSDVSEASRLWQTVVPSGWREVPEAGY